LITSLLFDCEITENARRGKPIPRLNEVKFSKLVAGVSNRKALAKKVAINAGLHGIIIAPKKNPKA
jgi:hypothetical protein